MIAGGFVMPTTVVLMVASIGEWSEDRSIRLQTCIYRQAVLCATNRSVTSDVLFWSRDQ